jgi:CelD/BcsL family acetyltransferase involved in cellulose biosynthesis
MDTAQTGELMILGTADALQGIRSTWNRLQRIQKHPDPNADFDHFVAVARHKPEVVRPCVLVLHEGREILAIVGGRIERHTADFKIGYRRVFTTPSRSLTVVSGGVLVDPRFSHREQLAAALRRAMKEQGADVLLLHSLDEQSPLFGPASRARYGFPLVLRSAPRRHWRTAVPETMEEFYQARSKNHRKNLKSHVRRLKRDFPDWEVRRFTRPEEVEKLFPAVEAVASSSYQRGLGVGFTLDRLTRERFLLAARRGWLRSYVLYLGGRPRAFQLAFSYLGCLFAKGKAYDQSFARYGPGTFLFLHALEEAVREKEVKWWDFGIGDSEYKQMYGTSFWTERNIYWCQGTPRGIATALTFGANSITARVSGKLAEASEIGRTVKKTWRKRAARREAA